jgi:hypothetical protein
MTFGGETGNGKRYADIVDDAPDLTQHQIDEIMRDSGPTPPASEDEVNKQADRLKEYFKDDKKARASKRSREDEEHEKE